MINRASELRHCRAANAERVALAGQVADQETVPSFDHEFNVTDRCPHAVTTLV